MGLTGEYNGYSDRKLLTFFPCLTLISVTLTARFRASSAAHLPAVTADLILPLSNVSQFQGSAFAVPPAGDVCINRV